MEPSDVEDYARAAAGLAGLEIDEAWWQGVVRHLGVLLGHAASVDAVVEAERMGDPAGVFHP